MTWRTPFCTFYTHYDAEPIVNVGWGEDVTIKELAELILSVIDYTGRLHFDTTKPDGTPRKLLDVTRLTELGMATEDTAEAGYRGYLRLVHGTFERGQTLENEWLGQRAMRVVRYSN